MDFKNTAMKFFTSAEDEEHEEQYAGHYGAYTEKLYRCA